MPVKVGGAKMVKLWMSLNDCFKTSDLSQMCLRIIEECECVCEEVELKDFHQGSISVKWCFLDIALAATERVCVNEKRIQAKESYAYEVEAQMERTGELKTCGYKLQALAVFCTRAWK